MPQLPLISTGDAGEIRQDIEQLFDELAARLPASLRAGAGECHPAIDVVETDQSIEIRADVAGIPAEALRLLFRDDVLMIVGEKAAPRPSGPRSFHLVEREFGRFARAVRVAGAFDIASARAELQDGELRVVLPRRDDRRGQAHRIPISQKSEER